MGVLIIMDSKHSNHTCEQHQIDNHNKVPKKSPKPYLFTAILFWISGVILLVLTIYALQYDNIGRIALYAILAIAFGLFGFASLSVYKSIRNSNDVSAVSGKSVHCAMCEKQPISLAKVQHIEDDHFLCVACHKMLKRIEVMLPSNFMNTLNKMSILQIEKALKKAQPIYDFWTNKDIHTTAGQVERQHRSQQVQLPVLIDEKNKIYHIHGARKNPYRVTLLSCDCKDYLERGLPCKHMYKLAFELGILK